MKDPVARKRSSGTSDEDDSNKDEPIVIDTVALMCIAVVSKEEYDSMMVKEIEPIIVVGKDQDIKINPFLLVGSLEKTREEAIKRVNALWDVYEQRKAE